MTDTETEDHAPPLTGVRVIDLGQIYQGPYATLLMAKAGADVVKVEPLQGEPMRQRADAARGAGIPLAMLNSNKRGLSLDLKQPAGKDLLKRLVRKADILLENFTPDIMNKLGVGWDVLHDINPRLIYASGTGWRHSHPFCAAWACTQPGGSFLWASAPFPAVSKRGVGGSRNRPLLH